MEPKIWQGGEFRDARGILRYVNEFDLSEVKRFYLIEHPDTNVIRAWQGHRREQKWFYVLKGSFCIAWVKIDEWVNPSTSLKPDYLIVKDSDNKLIHVPAGYANGLKALETDSRIIVFSDMDVNESIKEKIRYEPSLWLDWNSF